MEKIVNIHWMESPDVIYSSSIAMNIRVVMFSKTGGLVRAIASALGLKLTSSLPPSESSGKELNQENTYIDEIVRNFMMRI